VHVLFVHKNFPSQFGQIARLLASRSGFQSTFISEGFPTQSAAGIRRIRYEPRGGATKNTHYCSRTFENQVAHAHGVFEALKAHPDVKPDLIVGHSGFGSTLFLRELYSCPIINYFEYYYHPRNSDLDFRCDLPEPEINYLRTRARNAMLLLDLENCDAGCSPTQWQRSRFPAVYQPKIETIFDGIDCSFWRRRNDVPRQIAGREFPHNVRVVTYVARGFERMRGFDIFMQVAQRICAARADVIFIVVGSDEVYYGSDLHQTGAKTFREHVLAQDRYDLSRFVFTGTVSPQDLVRVFSLSDLHIYLTVPFLVGWSFFNALACGCTVLASNVAPVREIIEHQRTGLLANFFDLDDLTAQALHVLDDPAAFRSLGQAAAALIDKHYSLSTNLPQMEAFYHRVATGSCPRS
jgi:glycosyltransferase involved in cell wall biosynthesis